MIVVLRDRAMIKLEITV